jgi:hypothetical protein
MEQVMCRSDIVKVALGRSKAASASAIRSALPRGLRVIISTTGIGRERHVAVVRRIPFEYRGIIRRS